MKNRLTFANVINILLENKKKTYPQHKLICDLFGEYLGKSDYSDTIYAEDNTMYSRWCTGARPIPMEILRTYEEDDKWEYMEELIKDSISVIGMAKADELIAITDNANYFTQVIRYAILSDHEQSKAFSPDLSEDLQTYGLNISDDEYIELYKDGDYTEGLMAEHLRKLLQLGKLSSSQLDILRNLSLLPLSGVLKNSFKNWCRLPNLNDVNHLAKYGFIYDDTENRKISLHPLIQEIIVLETVPTISACYTMIDSLHVISLAHGLDVKKPQNVINSLISIAEHVIVDSPEYFLLFLQDMFPYLEKYLMTGVLALSEGIPAKAETCLLSAESIITDVMGTDNEYAKSVYKYLYNLYARYHKTELADSYRNKLLSRPDNSLLK